MLGVQVRLSDYTDLRDLVDLNPTPFDPAAVSSSSTAYILTASTTKQAISLAREIEDTRQEANDADTRRQMALDALENLEAEREQTEQKLNETLKAKFKEETIVTQKMKAIKGESRSRSKKHIQGKLVKQRVDGQEFVEGEEVTDELEETSSRGEETEEIAMEEEEREKEMTHSVKEPTPTPVASTHVVHTENDEHITAVASSV
ncbi:DgyrCDS7213 [Dimorphilus gyrociliatus]|uniref:DgyrCDS7213 n=1 Tax=Dimorphilus gyrociliatus TaxID=2664684 RepID=A0A7I8VSN5_9ANNE|nr:DgyrCDS7213 [Dimorphilus gyrociliatus]